MDKKAKYLNLQWGLLETLEAKGYSELCSFDGDCSIVHVSDNETTLPIKVLIAKEQNQKDTIWVHTEMKLPETEMPWHAGFTMSSSGKIIDRH